MSVGIKQIYTHCGLVICRTQIQQTVGAHSSTYMLERSVGSSHQLTSAVLAVVAAAVQIADRLNAAGVPCNLVTGQEVRLVQGARHTACTVEMADLDQRVEVSNAGAIFHMLHV